MKVLLLVTLLIYPLVSCTKNDAVSPKPVNKGIEPAFSSFSASAKKNGAEVQFTAKNESSVAYYEVFSGTDGHQLCIVSRLTPSTQKSEAHTYTYDDIHPEGDPMYYMIGYVLKDSTLKFNGQMVTLRFSKTD
ncbi:MAG TPA: hypothetical protein VFX43_10390 [Chitinophagaceae bacterium]|nr:hypothetical protein [Chitinophagaceae bacterium]